MLSNLADPALRKLRAKLPELILALDGRPDAHFRWMLAELLSKLDWLTEELARLDRRMSEAAAPYTDLLCRLATIPGIDWTTALVLVAEFGIDMTQFLTPGTWRVGQACAPAMPRARASACRAARARVTAMCDVFSCRVPGPPHEPKIVSWLPCSSASHSGAA